MSTNWIAERMAKLEVSGIRKVFELGRSLKDPVNLSIGLPDFDVPEPAKIAAKEAIDRGENSYTVTQGIPELRAKILARGPRRLHPHRPRIVHHQWHQWRGGVGDFVYRQSGR